MSNRLGNTSGFVAGLVVFMFLTTAVAFHVERPVRSALGLSVAAPSWKDTDTQFLYSWVRSHTGPSSVFLTSPDFRWSDFQWATERGMVFSGKNTPP